jgi:hypothetical protein
MRRRVYRRRLVQPYRRWSGHPGHDAIVSSDALGREIQAAATSGRPPPSEAVREAVTMALYVCIVLGAEFVAVADRAADESWAIGAIWGTAIGVALAHVFAFNLAARLFAGRLVSHEVTRAAWAQLGAAAAVAAVLSCPFLFLPLGPALDTSGFLLAALIGVTAYVASREAGAGRVRSLVDGLIVLAIAMAVVSVKVGLSGH